jgi:hypothetical protein
METIIEGRYILLKPPSNSISSLDKSSEATSNIHRNDFINTVKKTASPLSVTVRANSLKSIFNISLPSLKNGIKIEIKKGYRNTRGTLLISFFQSGLNNNKIIITTRK